MNSSPYKALMVDLDGTLLDREGKIHPRNREALRAADQAGVRVVVVTGRSKISTTPILDQLGLDSPAVVFNGAAVWCPREERMLEQRVLSNRSLERLLSYGRETDDLTLLMLEERKLCLTPRDEVEARSLRGLHNLEFVERDELVAEHCIRVTFLSQRPSCSATYAAEVEDFVDQPLYLTHFPLSMLSNHHESRMLAVDAHPPCRGKGEALRFVYEQWGIAAREVVAVGDAGNDLPMVKEAGLGVAMGNAVSELEEVADRVIGDNQGESLAELVEELFLS